MRHRPLFLLICLVLLTACRQTQVPTHFQQLQKEAPVYPDYTEVTVPVNIAPLNFELLAQVDAAVTRLSAGDSELTCDGLKVCPDIDEWRGLTAAALGKSISVEVYAEKDGQWVRFKPFKIYVSPDSIDAWLSYRMISPSYVSYEELTINQRCLENFDEQVIADNMLCSTEAGGQCVNCHSYQQWNPQRMQLHARQTHGGTLIAYDGKVEKIDWSTLPLSSPPVYPAWHPTQRLIAYSTNKTMQAFHTADLNKIEVIDGESNLVIYDIDRHEMKTVENRPDELETFPCWTPDGRWLYYCSARFKYQADSVDLPEITLRYQQLKYNIYRKPFNTDTHQFGERQLVFAADSLGMSATLPRISPDGRWLLFTMGQWGCFHIWHRDADLWMMPLDNAQCTMDNAQCTMDNAQCTMDNAQCTMDNAQCTMHNAQLEAHPLTECNSDDTESCHSWSGNGRWVVFSSRRYDGVFTRPFFAHIDKEGHVTKPFELPCKNPDRHRQLMKSYNVPELMRGPVTLKPQQIAAELKKEGIKAKHLNK